MLLNLLLLLIDTLTNYISLISFTFYVHYFYKMPLITLLLVFVLLFVRIETEQFPSLITTNATLAVVLDKEYLTDRYESIKTAIETYLIYAKRDIIKHGGVNVQYYAWSSIYIRRDFTAILSIASCSDTWRLFRTAVKEHLLHMAISEADCPRLPVKEAVTIPLIRRGEELPQILLDLRISNAYRWKSVVVIYDETLNQDQVTRIVKSLTKESQDFKLNSAAISLMKLNTNLNSIELKQTINDTLLLLKQQQSAVGVNFMAIVSYPIVLLIMEYANNLGLVNVRNQWIYIVSNTDYYTRNFEQLKTLLKEGDNVAFIYNNTITNNKCVGGLQCHTEEVLNSFARALDDAIEDEFSLANQVSDEEWEAIRPSKLERKNYLLRKLKEYSIKYGICDNCTRWLLKTGDTWGREYQPNLTIIDDGVADLIPVGNWRATDGLTLDDELFPHISHGFRGRNLPLVSFHNPPWQIIKYNESGIATKYSGLVFDIIKELSKTLNFTYSVEILKLENEQLSNNNSFQKKNDFLIDIVTNFIPDRIIEMIKNKSAVFGACAFTIAEKNKHHINFTHPISTQTYTFLVARPKELSRALLFMSPFTGDTWLCLTLAILLMGPILYFIHRYSPVYEYKGIRSNGGLSSIENCIWYMYGALLQQGGMYLPYADSARLIVGSWWLVVLVLATTYCGNLVAFLTFPKIDIAITTIDDLLSHQDTVTWSFVNGSFLEDQLRTTNHERFKWLYDKRVTMVRSKELIQKIEKGEHVFIDWKIRLQFIMKTQYLETDRCDLALGMDEFYNEQLAMIVAQDTPYIDIINAEIKKLHQVGLIEKWLKDYLPKRDRCWKNRHLVEVNNHTVNMDDMQGSFFVLFLGFVLSLLIIIGEKLWHKYKVQKRERIIQPFTT